MNSELVIVDIVGHLPLISLVIDIKDYKSAIAPDFYSEKPDK